MTWATRVLRTQPDWDLTPDQRQAFDAYSRDGGRVCVDAGAGTGKTTTLVETLAEAVLQDVAGKPADFNPMKRILVVSFGREASRQLKTKLKERLRAHEGEGGTVPPTLWRYIETQSDIGTIDSFMQSILREVVVELGLNPAFDIPTAVDQDTLVDGILERMRSDPKLRSSWVRLENAFPSFDNQAFGPPSVRAMVWGAHQKSREFCLESADVKSALVASVQGDVHAGSNPPFGIAMLRQLATQLSGGLFTLQCPPSLERQMASYAEDVYNNSVQLATDFGDLLVAFDKEYDKLTRERGTLSYTDIAYLVWHYTFKDSKPEWKDSLRMRYDHILVDEFQDTNFVQYQVLSSLIRDAPTHNRMMFIGDVKQSIYQWRSAEPQIFADLILGLRGGRTGSAPRGMVYSALTTNFRSNPELLDFYNGVFSTLFEQKSRGGVAGEVPYTSLGPKPNLQRGGGPKVHVRLNPGDYVDTWVESEIEDVAGTVRGLLSPDTHVRVRADDGERKPVAKDIAILFRRNRNVPRYVQALRDSGISCAVQTDISLFAEHDTSLIIDFLDWLANPESRESITRILRSPLVALDDKTLRYLASQSYRLVQALQRWPSKPGLPVEDNKRLKSLLRFRDDLRWDREGRKASLINKIISYGHLDSVLLASTDGVQAQANLWTLSEVVAAWEDEELLNYKQFLALLKELRERAEAGREKDYNRAIMADEETDAVKVMTIHAAKGREFPIVIIPETIVYVDEANDDRLTTSRLGGIILRPRASGRIAEPNILIAKQGETEGIRWVGKGAGNALLWLSPQRGTNGEYLVTGRISQDVRDAIAEFWRILYVAMTRAKDHLVFSISTESTWNKLKWNSWMTFLRSNLGLDAVGNTANQLIDVSLGGVRFQVAVNDLPIIPSPTPTPLVQVPKPTQSAVAYTSGARSFLPSEINPSTFPILVECPRRYQYQVLWEDSGLREDMLKQAPSGSKPPKGMSANEWGTKVHDALRLRDFSTDPQYDIKFQDFLSRIVPSTRDALVSAVKNFEALPIGKAATAIASNGKDLLKEQTLSSTIFVGQGVPPILVNGKFDLLFEEDSAGWTLVDYKIEVEPPAGSFRDRLYRGQIHAYSWLISKVLGHGTNHAYLAYLHPYPSLVEIKPEPDWFIASATSALTSMSLDPGKGLQAKPSYGSNGSCSACPYSKEVGGPCEN